jgi:hypothetical protein
MAAILIPEVIVMLAGIAGLWVIWRLREGNVQC